MDVVIEKNVISSTSEVGQVFAHINSNLSDRFIWIIYCADEFVNNYLKVFY